MLLLASCVSQPNTIRLSAAQLSVAQVVGAYQFGDGIAPKETLVLYKDGSFSSTISGDLIAKPVTYYGRWSLWGDKVTFHDLLVCPGLQPIHTYAITELYKGKVVLLPGEYARRHSISHFMLYTKKVKIKPNNSTPNLDYTCGWHL